jgi:hypothetical protein
VPIRVRCPKCNETAELPDEARGKRGLCNRCGSVVNIPAEPKKVCVFCHADVTSTSHIKDPDKNYVCESCWKGRHPDAPKLQDTVAPASAEPELAPTSTLDPEFANADPTHSVAAAVTEPPASSHPAEHHDDDPPARVAVTDWPYDHRPSFGRLRPKPRRATPLSTAFSIIALAISCATAYLVWTRDPSGVSASAQRWDQTNGPRILVLKGQAEVLVETGHLKEGIARYEELERFVKDKPIRDPALRDELLAAWRARDAAVAQHLVVEQVNQSNRAQSATPVPPTETTITLIEEPPTTAAPRQPTHPDAAAAPTTQRSAFDPN